jgi:predicted metal-dependent peptidase
VRLGDDEAGETILAVDTSISMGGAVQALSNSDQLEALASQYEARSVALVDTAVRDISDVRDAVLKMRCTSCSGLTDLTGPVSELLERYGRVILVTDENGTVSLPGNPVHAGSRQMGDVRVEIVEVTPDGI